MSTPGTIVRRTQITGTNNPAFQVSKDVANDSFIIASAAPNGSVLVRDSGQTDGWGFDPVVAPAGTLTGATLAANVLASSLTSVGTLAGLSATGQVKMADGTALLPAYSFTGAATLGFWRSSANAVALVGGDFAVTGGSISAAAAGNIYWAGRSIVKSPADGQLGLSNQAASSGIGLDVATDAVLKVRTRAQSSYATVDALGYQASGAAGVSFGPAAVASITVVNGIVTACS